MVHHHKMGLADSQRLALLRFPLIVCVVFIHAAETSVHFQGESLDLAQVSFAVSFVRNLVSHCLASAAVPLFFLISGYLFFQGFEWSWPGYRAKLASRVQTLLIPFLFWNMLTLLLWTLGQNWPVTQHLFSGSHQELPNLSWREGAAAVLGIGRAPVAYQFWFVRDLMVLVLLVPLIAWLLRGRWLGVLLVATLFVCRSLDLWWLPSPSSEASAFFCLGAFLAQRRISPFVLDGWAAACMLAYPLALLADALILTRQGELTALHKLVIFMGPLFFLCLSANVRRREALCRALLGLSPAAFFVFAAHEPLLMLSRKMVYKLWAPQADWAVLGLYFAVPISVIAVLLLVRKGLVRWAPNFTSVVTGGR